MALEEISAELFEKSMAELRVLHDISKIEISPHHENTVIALIQKLFDAIPYVVTEQEYEKLIRISINRDVAGSNRRLTNISQLKYPPKHKVKKYGRCNIPEESIFYCSMIGLTSIKELKPKVGDLITETTWELQDKYRLVIVPLFYNQPTNAPFKHPDTGEVIPRLINPQSFLLQNRFEQSIKDYPPRLKSLSTYAMKVISEFFARDINSKNHLNYIYSAIFAHKFLYEVPKSDKIDAIQYPSVQSRLNDENLAIKPESLEKHYKLTEISEQIVIQDPSMGNGAYIMTCTGNVIEYDNVCGKIFWDKARYFDKEKNERFQNLFGLDLSY